MAKKLTKKRTLSDAEIRTLLLGKIQELIEEASIYLAESDTWLITYLESALILARTVREHYPAKIQRSE